jgi:hypothetical protein
MHHQTNSAHGALLKTPGRNFDMRTILLTASLTLSIGLIGLAGMSASQAMPIAALDQVAAEASLIATTSAGCGLLGHRGPFGHCRPIFSCPAGWHSGPFGEHCYRN